MGKTASPRSTAPASAAWCTKPSRSERLRCLQRHSSPAKDSLRWGNEAGRRRPSGRHACCRSSSTIKVFGIFGLYTPEVGFFNEGEQRLLREVAGQISFALDNITKTERLDYLAFYDALTGLANRTLLLQRLARDLEGAAARQSAARDRGARHRSLRARQRLLRPPRRRSGARRQMVGRLLQCLGEPGRAARVGPDEIVAIIPDARSENDVARTVMDWHSAHLQHSIPHARRGTAPDGQGRHRDVSGRWCRSGNAAPARADRARRSARRAPTRICSIRRTCLRVPPSAWRSRSSCAKDSRTTSSSCTTSRRSTRARVASSAWKRWCAGRVPSSGWCRRTSSFR